MRKYYTKEISIQKALYLYIDRCKQTAVKIFIFFPDVTQKVAAAGQGGVFCSIPLLHGVGYIILGMWAA